MRLDAELRSFIIDVWSDRVIRKRVVEVLTKLPEPLAMMCVGRGCLIVRDVDTRTLVITENVICYGWPTRFYVWRRV